MIFNKDELPVYLGYDTKLSIKIISEHYKVDLDEAENIFYAMKDLGIIYYERPSIVNGMGGGYRYDEKFDWDNYNANLYTKHRYLATCTNTPIDYDKDFQCIIEWDKVELDDLIKIIQEEFIKKYPKATLGVIVIHNLIEIGYPTERL